MLFDFDDILIETEVHTDIYSRKIIDPFDGNRMLPLFTAPMDTVVDNHNYSIFNQNKIYSILPRTESDKHPNDYYSTDEFVWCAYGLDEFKRIFIQNHINLKEGEKVYALIDIANGHMKILRDLVEQAKKIYGKSLVLMAGNCAHPLTYLSLAQLGVDYIRMGIGNGGGCLTTQQTGIGYPMASLIHECSKIQQERNLTSMIVADGGFKKYSDIIKALALGADYVMLGSIFNKALESAGDTYAANIKHDGWKEPGEKVDQFSETILQQFLLGREFHKKFRGMSTKEVQKSLGKTEIKTSEGISRLQKVEYTLEGWVNNFEHYLRTAMSYTDCRTLGEFIGKVRFNQITKNSLERFSK